MSVPDSPIAIASDLALAARDPGVTIPPPPRTEAEQEIYRRQGVPDEVIDELVEEADRQASHNATVERILDRVLSRLAALEIRRNSCGPNLEP